MKPPIPEAWLLLVFLVHLTSVTALDVTYPKIGTVYPATGPYDVQWEETAEFEPSELAIYLVTYEGQNITNHLACIVSATSDGSTAITLSNPAPQGDSWTWMFYDNDYYIDLGYSYIAQSVHFQIQSATPTTSAASSSTASSFAASSSGTNSVTSSSIQLSPAIAAAIGVGGTVLVVVVALLVCYFCIYRRRQLKKKHETISAIPYTPGYRSSKQELDSKPGTSHGSSYPKSTNILSSADVKVPSHHEMGVYPGTGSAALSSPSVASPDSELSVTTRHSRLTPLHAGPPTAPVNELPVSPMRYEMHHDAQRAYRHELPGDIDLGNARNKEWY